MSPIAQRVAIAERCGWRWFEVWPLGAARALHLVFTDEPWKSALHELRPTERRDLDEALSSAVPDYLSDLAAVIAAVRELGLFEKRRLIGHLWTLLRLPVIRAEVDDEAVDSMAALLTATPAQIAEAFVRAIEKWEA